MSRSLQFEQDAVDQPAARDYVERLTWSSVRIRVGQRDVSRLWDRSLECERSHLYLPTFPLAAWLVANWWSLFHEGCPWVHVPQSVAGERQWQWAKRHCLRSADSALMLPALYVFHDGRQLRAVWRADASESQPHMPGVFVNDGEEVLEACATQEMIACFIDDCLSRLHACSDERVNELAETWRAIRNADDEERKLCTLAGRLGVNPYDADELTDDLASFIESARVEPDDPLVRDLTDVATAELFAEQWRNLRKVEGELSLEPMRVERDWTQQIERSSPPQFGYQLARAVRERAHIDPWSPLASVEEVAQTVLGKLLRTENRDLAAGCEVQALVGISGGDVVSAGRLPPEREAKRFRMARSLYLALASGNRTLRLVTTAHSWDQQASRAFAAELLAPRQALVRALDTVRANRDPIECLSKTFDASKMVIKHQLDNAGVPTSMD